MEKIYRNSVANEVTSKLNGCSSRSLSEKF